MGIWVGTEKKVAGSSYSSHERSSLPLFHAPPLPCSSALYWNDFLLILDWYSHSHFFTPPSMRRGRWSADFSLPFMKGDDHLDDGRGDPPVHLW